MTDKESPNYAQLSIDQPAQYRIRIKGELERQWSDRMGGVQIRQQTQDDGSILTCLEGKLVDQAALFGVLVTLYNLRLPLISVECLETDREGETSLIKVKIEQKADYLEFILTGIVDDLQAPEPLETVLNSCKLAGLYRVLVDYRGLSMVNEEELGVEYAQGVGQRYQEYLATGDSPLRIALIGREDMIEKWKSNEEIARGYGLEVFITSNYEEAIAWLKNDKKSQ